jgi:ribonuclease P/MRP protein subunit RPP1
MSFYDLMKAYPEGSASASRMALAAKRMGYEGIVICNAEPARVFQPEAAERVGGIDVIIGAQIAASNPRALHSRIQAMRARYPLIAVSGGTEEIVRAACENASVDLLMHPCHSRMPLGIACARAAEQNQVAIGFDLRPLVRLRGPPRARWLEAAMRNLVVARKFDLTLAITAGAESHLDLRSPRDLIALAEVAGFEPGEAKAAMMLPGRLAQMNRRKWTGPGMELL